MIGCALLIGCDNDPTKLDYHQPLAQVAVTDVTTGQPVAGVKVLAVRDYTNTPVAGPFETNAAGEIEMGVDPGALTGYLVFGGTDWILHDQQYGNWKTLGAEKIPPVQNPLTSIFVRPAAPVDGIPRIAGTIIDAISGEPLHQAIISTVPDLAAYNGAADPGSDITSINGAFTVHEIAFTTNPGTGNLSQVETLFISRVGYRPRRWVYEHANGDDNLDISGVEIALTPLSANDTGVLTGRILLRGQPQSNVWVGLGGFVANKSGMGVLGQTARTDNEGIYEFTGLASGTYIVDPGFLLNDQIIFPNQSQPPVYDVTSGQTVAAEDLLVFQEISSLASNLDSFSISDEVVLLQWTPVQDALVYRVYVAGDEPGSASIAQHLWAIPPGATPGWYRWSVVADSANHESLGAMQIPAWFELVE